MTKILLIGDENPHTFRFERLFRNHSSVLLELANYQNYRSILESKNFDCILVMGISTVINELASLKNVSIFVFSMGYDLNFITDKEHLDRYNLNHCKGIIVDSKRNLSLLKDFGILESKLINVPYGCDLQVFGANQAKKEKKMKIFVNRGLTKIHRLDLASDAIQTLLNEKIDLEVMFIGDSFFNNSNLIPLLKYTEKGIIKVLPSLPSKMLNEVMQSNWIYLSTSSSDGTSISLLESMAAGLIPVVSDWESNLDWVIDGYNGYLFKNGDKMSLVSTLMKLESMTETTFHIMQERNARIVKNRGDWVQNGKKIHDFIIERC